MEVSYTSGAGWSPALHWAAHRSAAPQSGSWTPGTEPGHTTSSITTPELNKVCLPVGIPLHCHHMHSTDSLHIWAFSNQLNWTGSNGIWMGLEAQTGFGWTWSKVELNGFSMWIWPDRPVKSFNCTNCQLETMNWADEELEGGKHWMSHLTYLSVHWWQ